MPTARSRKQVQGREIFLSIKKPGGSTFTVVGCAEDITYKSDKESLKYSCRAGSGKLPSGDDPDWSLSMKGFYFIYASGDQATNVSFLDFHGYHTDDVILEAKWGSDKTDDPIFEGKLFIKSISLEAPNAGLATYAIEAEGNEPVTVTESE